MPAVVKRKAGRPKSPTPPKEKILAVRIPPDLDAALESFRASHSFPPDRTAVTLRALANFLSEQGHHHPRGAA